MSVHVRTLRPDDGPLLDAVLAGLSPHNRYLRFHSPLPRVPAGIRRALLDVDGCRHLALVALAGPGEPVGIARAVRDADHPAEAEVAFEVVDAWQRRGVGRLLLTAVAERAAAAGITRLHAMVLAENRPALALMRAVFPLCLSRRDGAVVELTALLGGAEITMDDVVADLAA
ncbi:MAG: GNAT family N-acetyltransferase [Actinomycetota bacterium]|nr:GNAT family N-acetyltransferase [Actinomycetota bacterium]